MGRQRAFGAPRFDAPSFVQTETYIPTWNEVLITGLMKTIRQETTPEDFKKFTDFFIRILKTEISK